MILRYWDVKVWGLVISMWSCTLNLMCSACGSRLNVSSKLQSVKIGISDISLQSYDWLVVWLTSSHTCSHIDKKQKSVKHVYFIIHGTFLINISLRQKLTCYRAFSFISVQSTVCHWLFDVSRQTQVWLITLIRAALCLGVAVSGPWLSVCWLTETACWHTYVDQSHCYCC